MPSSEKIDELQVYKMLERLGIELGAGVVPRYGLMDISAVRNCRRRGAAPAVAPDCCPNHDMLLEGTPKQ